MSTVIAIIFIGLLLGLCIGGILLDAQRCSWCREEQGLPPLPKGRSSKICQRHHDLMMREVQSMAE